MSNHFSPEQLRHVKYLWDDSHANALDPVARLVYRSNILGADGRITNTGGGNTSAKVTAKDPLTGETVEVLWVKGSGGDVGTMRLDGFATLYMSRLEALKGLYRSRDASAITGPRTSTNADSRSR